MRTKDVHVATMMWARSEAEGELLETSLQSLTRLHLPIAVADGGSPQPVVDFVTRLPGISLTMARGLVHQVKASVHAAVAAGREFILYSEPDKHGFFEHGLAEFLEQAPADAGLVVAARNEESLLTFPPFQQLTERTINHLTGAAVGGEGDYSFGPFLMHRKLVELLELAPDSIGWGWRHFLFAMAKRKRIPVVLFPGDYPCPPEQRAEQEIDRAHRLDQLDQNLLGLMLATG